MSYYFGFNVGDRVISGEKCGTVTKPNYEPSDKMHERRCVPVVWDEDKSTNTICWTMSANLRKL